jgi:hypothetical protein
MARKLTTALRGFVLQSAADVLGQTFIPTGLRQEENFGLLITRVEFTLSATELKAWANADIAIFISLHRGHQTTLIMDHRDYKSITHWTFGITAQTSSVDILIPGTFTWTPPANLVIADEEMTLSIYSVATGQKNLLSAVVYAERTVLTPGQVIQLRAL